MDDFTKCPMTAEIQSQIYRLLPQFVFYRKKGRKAECYCTSCHSWYDDGCSKFRTFQSIDNYKHNNYGICTNCGEAVQFKAMGRGLKSYSHKQNFAVFFHADDTVYIRCFLAKQYFIADRADEPDYNLTEVTRYSLRAGKAVQYKFHWQKRGWEAKTGKPHEPVFQMSGGFGYIPNNSYTTLNNHCLAKSFLRYHVADLPKNINDNFITYLCCCAVHPNIEYLVKGGFCELAMTYVDRKAGVHINWRSNDLLKMLRINRTELKFLKDGSALKYRDYVNFRRKIYKGKSAEDTILFYELFCRNCEHLELIHSKTGLPYKRIMDYVRKQAKAEHTSVYHTCIDYRDYIRECEKLEYDFTDSAVIAPRSLYDAHRRTSDIINAAKNAAAAELFAEHNKDRQKLLFADEEKGLMIVLPESMSDIIDEGMKLSHCVGGYAERHAEGKLHIAFLRKISEPKTPYYTIEVSTEGKIIQCRGYANNTIQRGGSIKPQVVRDFEQEYQEHLNTVFKKERETA